MDYTAELLKQACVFLFMLICFPSVCLRIVIGELLFSGGVYCAGTVSDASVQQLDNAASSVSD